MELYRPCLQTLCIYFAIKVFVVNEVGALSGRYVLYLPFLLKGGILRTFERFLTSFFIQNQKKKPVRLPFFGADKGTWRFARRLGSQPHRAVWFALFSFLLLFFSKANKSALADFLPHQVPLYFPVLAKTKKRLICRLFVFGADKGTCSAMAREFAPSLSRRGSKRWVSTV